MASPGLPEATCLGQSSLTGLCELQVSGTIPAGLEEPAKENVLANPDETTDIIFEVEGRELHACRAVLAHYSPVFQTMLFSTFKEKLSASKIPLPGKKYQEMVTFFNVLYPRSASATCLINDYNLKELLAIADEYQTDKVLAMGQDYIGGQLFHCFHKFYQYSLQYQHSGRQPVSISAFGSGGYSFGTVRTTTDTLSKRMRGQKMSKEAMIQKLMLYLWACDIYQLPSHRDVIKSLLVDLATCLNDITQSKHYLYLPKDSKVDLLEALCRKLDGSRVF